MNDKPAGRRLSDIALERFRLDELPLDLAGGVEQRIATDEQLQRRLHALARSDDEIRVSYPRERFVESISTRLGSHQHERRTTPRWTAMYWMAAVAAATAVVTLVLVIPPRTSAPLSGRSSAASPPADRIKGLAPALRVYRKTSTTSEMLADGAFARRGDLVRVGYEAAGRPYGLIVSIDGRGGVTRHLPLTGELAARLEPSSTVLLDQAYELDDAPRWERFYFITGTSQFPVMPVLEAARRAAATSEAEQRARLTLAQGLEQTTFFLQKEDTP
jgi:hypothetical protein